ncbi:glycosyltransferase family 4 protein [Robiginitalea sp. IMCC43444]|uniref:glycosyltransferase family 4 protein n=1 Tax=Robiginitalea sp. IMCC43444 TaxID=3459121 RepID=UPI004042EE80
MKIVYLIDQIYLHGGIERVLSLKANYFASRPDFEVVIITTEQKGHNPCYNFDSRIRFFDLGIDYNRKTSFFHPKNLLKIPKHFNLLKKIIANVKPDVLVVCNHGVDTFFVPLGFKKIATIKEYHFSQHTEKEKRLTQRGIARKLFHKLSDYIANSYDRLVVLNDDEARYFRSPNVQVIPNPTSFYPKYHDAPRKAVAIAAGRIAPVKGFDDLIKIWSIVKKEIPDLHLHIYGEGSTNELHNLERIIEENDLSTSVFLKGKTDRIQEKFKASSIYCMSSHNECFPLVLLEAQSCGLPVIAFDCPHGPKNILNENTGILISERDKNAYAKAVIELYRNKQKLKKMRFDSHQNVYKYKIDEIMPIWANLFLELQKKAEK